MNFRGLTKITILVAVTVLCSNVSSAKDDPLVNPLLVDTWRHEDSGGALSIKADGTFAVTSAEGAQIISGTIKSQGWESVGWHPGSLVHAILVRLNIDEREWVLSGYYSLGEGDPGKLEFFAGVFPAVFIETFGVDWESRVLQFRGSGP